MHEMQVFNEGIEIIIMIECQYGNITSMKPGEAVK